MTSRVQLALEQRKNRVTSAASGAKTVSAENGTASSRVQAALAARDTRMQSSAGAAIAEIQRELNTEISAYNDAFTSEEKAAGNIAGSQERIKGIDGLKLSVNAWRKYMTEGAADEMLDILGQMEQGWVLSDIQNGLNTEIEAYNNAKPVFGNKEETSRNQEASRANISGLKDTVNTRRDILPEGAADKILETLGQIEQGYDGQLEMASYASQEEWDAAIREVRTYAGYMALEANSDFAELSKYVPQQKKKRSARAILMNDYSDAASGWDDPLYEAINGNTEAQAWLQNAGAYGYSAGGSNPIGSVLGQVAEGKTEAQQMTDDEVKIFNYLYAKEGKERAHEYYYLLQDALWSRERAADEQYWKQQAIESPVKSSLFSVAISPIKGLSAVGQIADYAVDGKVNEDASYNRFSYVPSAIRGQVASDIEKSGKWGEVGSWTYQLGMSTADFLMNTAVSGGSSKLSLTLMYSNAMADEVIAAKDRGLNDDQAMILGLVAGGAEVITEKFSLDALFKGDVTKGAMKYILTNALTEGTEEVASSLINTFADILVSKDKSEWKKAIAEYMEKNPNTTEQEAFQKVLADTALSLGLDFLGGSLMGGTMGTGGATINYAFNASPNLQVNKDALSQYGNNINALIQEGLQNDPNSDSYDLAQYYQKQINKGKSITGYQIRNLIAANQEASAVKTIRETALNRLTELGATGEAANRTAELIAQFAAGQKLSAAQKRFLESSPYAAQVTQEIVDWVTGEETFADTVAEEPDGVSLPTLETDAGVSTQNEIENGGNINVRTEQGAAGPAAAQAAGEQAGAGVLYGSGQRNDSPGTGEQAGSLAGSAKQQSAERINASRAAVARQNLARSLRLEKVSSLDLGLASGTEAKTVQVIPQEHWDGEMAQLDSRIYNETGKHITFVVGRIQVNGIGGGISYARGAINGEQIIVQADNFRATMEQIADHEAYHAKIDFAGQRLNEELRQHIIDTFSEEQFGAVLNEYIKALRGVIDVTGNMTAEEYENAIQQIEEEVFADAYAGINAFGAGADRFTETVNAKMDSLYLGKQKAQDNGTAEPTGPPAEESTAGAERYSADEDVPGLSLPTLEDADDGTTLSDKETDRVVMGMTDAERYNVLKNKRIDVVTDTVTSQYSDVLLSLGQLKKGDKSKAEKIIYPLAEKLGITKKQLTHKEVDVDFIFSKNGGLKESLSKQLRYGGTYEDFAKALVNLDRIINNSVLIETHRDKYAGTIRADENLEAFYVLFGAFQDGNNIIPVQMEIKKSSDVGGRLYMTVALTKIEADVLGSTPEGIQTRFLIPASMYTLTDIFKEINPKEGHFLKYLPDEMLMPEQIEGKRQALAEDAKRIEGYAKKNKTGFSREDGNQNDLIHAHSSYGTSPVSAENVPQEGAAVKERFSYDEEIPGLSLPSLGDVDSRNSVDDTAEDDIPGLSLPTLEDLAGDPSGPKENTARGGEKVKMPERMNFTLEEKTAIQGIGRKSINQFSKEDVEATEKVARRYWEELGEKSPFFRAWFGDWRVNDQTPVQIADQLGDARGVQRNVDTGWNIQVSGKVFNESRHNAIGNQRAMAYLPYINDIVSKAVLLDSFGISATKSPNTLLMHSMYAVADIGNGPELLKLYVEELNDPNKDDTGKRAYQLRNIENQQPSVQGSGNILSPITSTADIKTVSDLFAVVKAKDANFNPKPASKVVNADGTPKVVYHGSAEQFTTFSYGHIGGSTGVGILGDGFYFTDKKRLAKGYGKNLYPVYLQMKNPYIATESDAYKLRTEEIQQQGYDGVILQAPQGDVYMVFENTQIKSATDNIGTFDGSNPDIRYSVDDTAEDDIPGLSLPTLEEDSVQNDYIKEDVSAETIEADIGKVATMESVAQITGEEFTKGEKDLVTQVTEFFAELNNRAYNPQLGSVILDRQGVRSDIAHGIGRKKAAAFAAVPDVLARGYVVDYQKNWKGRGYDTAVVAAPVRIGSDEYLMGIVLNRNQAENKFYVHEVLTTENEAPPFKTGTRKGNPSGDAPSVFSILDRIRNVKANNVGTERYSVDDTAEDDIPGLSLPTLEDTDIGESTREDRSILEGTEKYNDELTAREYNRLSAQKPMKVSAQEWTMIKAQRKTRYSNLEEYDIPTIDFFRIGDYRIPNNGFVYYIRNSGADTFSVVAKKRIVPSVRSEIREVLKNGKRIGYETTDTGTGQETSGRRFDRGSIDNAGDGRKLPGNDRGSVKTEESEQELSVGKSHFNSRARVKERYSVDDTEQEKKSPKKATKPVAESKPIIAKRDLRNKMLNLFSVPDGQRAELGEVIDGYADRLLKNGSITEEDRKVFFDRMYDAGVMTVPAEEYWSEARSHIAKGRIYVSQRVKQELGDDWNDLRRRAFAAGVYLVNDPSASGIDQWNATLAEQDMLPGLFDAEDTDLRAILERIVQVAEEGRDEQMSLAEYTAMLAKQEYVSEAEILDNMERQMDWALRTFAEKAKLEIHLRDRTGVKIAQEREKGTEKLTMQRVKDAQRRAEERQERKEMAQRQRERKELRELQQKTMKQLRWLSKNRYRAPEELQATWDEVLGDIDLYAVSAANEMHWSEKHQATWKDLAQMYKDAQKNDPNFLPSKELQMIVDRLDATKIADLDIGALQDLYKAAVGLRTEFYNRNNVINDEMHRLFAEVYTDAKQEIENAPGTYTGKPLDKLFNLEQLTPMNVLQRMGGWDPDGVFYSFAKQLEKGERDMRAYSVKAKRMLQEFLTDNEAWVRKADGQGKDAIWYELEVPELLELHMGDKPIFGDTVKVWMTPAQKVHMYLESKNVDNLRHMTGGRTFADKELYSEGKRQEAFAQGKTIRLAPETVKQIVSDLTAEEMELARLLEQYYNSFATQEINKVSNILYGYDKAMGKNYAPIYTNRNYTKTEFGVFDVTAEGVGNLKGRQYAVNPSYNIGAFDAFERHVEQTARFCGMAIPARNWTTLMNWRVKNNSTADVITHKWGEEGKKYIEDLITVLQAGEEQKTDTISAGLSKLQSNYISAVFGANPSIVLKQLGSIPLASAYLGVGYVPSVKQIASIDRDLISKYTQDLAWRLMGYSMPETKILKDNPNWTDRNKFYSFTFGGGAITAMDGWAASTLWPWAENKVRKEHPELEVGTQAQIDAGESAFYKKVAEEFENAVARSQSTSDEIHQSRLRKSKNPITRAFTLFRSDSAQTYNAIRQKIGEAQYAIRMGKDDAAIKAAKTAAGAAFGALLLNAAWSETVSFLMALWKNKGKKYRDDEDELTAESVLGEMATNMLGSVAGTVTGGEELFEVIGNIITGEKWYGIDTPGMEQLNDVLETVMESGKGLRELISGAVDVAKNGGDLGIFFTEHKNDILGQIKEVAETTAMYLNGVPAANVEAYLMGAFKWISPEFEAAYDDVWASVGKSDLSGLTGDALASRLDRILEDRNIQASDEALDALSALYEAGEADAVPADVPGSVTIGETTHKLGAYQQQAYSNIWSNIVSEALEDIVTSRTFAELDSSGQAKMLSQLYSYATARTKNVLFDDYELPSSAVKINELKATGLGIADCFGLVAQGADADDYLELTENGVGSDEAFDFVIRQEEMEEAAGEEGLENLDKWRLSVDFFDDVDDQLAALSMVMSDAQMINAEVANDFGVKPDVLVTFYEERVQYDADGNGSYKQSEIKATIDAEFGHLSNTQKATLWQIFNSSAKNNPYSQAVGQRVLDAKAAMKNN